MIQTLCAFCLFFSQVKQDQEKETDRLLGGTPIQKDVARVKSPDCRRLLHKTGSSAEDSSGYRTIQSHLKSWHKINTPLLHKPY